MVAESGEVDAVASWHTSARGSSFSTDRMVAELVDTVGRRVDDSGYGYGGGTAAVASAMAEGSEGERQGENGRVQGVRCVMWRRVEASRWRGRRQAGREVAW